MTSHNKNTEKVFITELLGQQLDDLSLEAQELCFDESIPYLDHAPTALQFQRDWISKNRPVIIKGAIKHWRSLKYWTYDYLRETMGENQITVAVTPDGYADAVRGDKFVMPEERKMTMGQFLDILESPNEHSGVFYVQKQNSNLTEEFEDLNDDVEPHIPFATDAFDSLPDAVNFWMGDGRAVTSLHKDNYENIYCVIKGEKIFTLIPPTDQALVPYEDFPGYVYKEDESNKGKWNLNAAEEDYQQEVPWIPIDPLKPDLHKYPDFAKTRRMQVRVREGECLYLPSLWFHHVQQSHGCIAVNYWYDMQYDIKFVYYKFVESLVKERKRLKKQQQSTEMSEDDLTEQLSKLSRDQ